MSNNLVFRFIDNKQLGKSNSLETMFLLLNENNYQISMIRIGHWATELHAFWHSFDDLKLDELALAYKKGMIEFHISDNGKAGGVLLTLTLEWTPKTNLESKMNTTFAIVDNPKMFKQEQYKAEENSNILLEIATLIYSSLSPDFGWIETCKGSGFTTIGDVESRKLPHIYWANFLGPEYVKTYSKDFFQKAPGHDAVSLDDGGLLYVLSPTLAKRQKKLLASVKEYFKVDGVRGKLFTE